ncbi:MAG: hypothetical protein IJ019_01055 [Alphaproteobacteria bacterium]|nr:hypothetical protein [Alphaproteobacteria bacterium]
MIEIIPEVGADITAKAKLSDICFDKFGMDLLRPKLEERFSILISDDELDSFKTVDDIVKFVRSRSKKL